ncbi:MAG: FAD-dependent oxidoreductase [Burkholderiaceae bacterium]
MCSDDTVASAATAQRSSAGGRHVAIVGSGASGCYAAEALLKGDAELRVDVIERLPTPFGLIRYGVAPDHQGTKAVTRTLERVLDNPRVAFFGGVTVGRQLSLAVLDRLYDAVILATGVNRDRALGIGGETLDGVVGSGRLASWYNDHPLADALGPAVAAARKVVIVGAGNVALDVARVLTKEPAAFAGSDIADDVLAALRQAPGRRIVVLARRGLHEARFSPGELRELIRMMPGRVFVEARSRHACEPPAAAASPVIRELLALPEPPAALSSHQATIEFRFDCRPTAFLPARPGSTRLGAVAIEAAGGGTVVEAADLAVTCIGYDHADALGLHTATGRLTHEDGRVRERLYVVGWAKRGPSGTIGTNRADSHKVAARVLAESQSQPERQSEAGGLRAMLQASGHRWVDLDGWRRIDAEERRCAGSGRLRRKLRRLDALLALGVGGSSPEVASPEAAPTASTEGARCAG